MDELLNPIPEQLVQIQGIPVAEAAREHGLLLLHAMNSNGWVATNSPLMPEHADFQTRLEVCLAFEPQLSASTISPENPDRRLAGDRGLIIAGGIITDARDDDSGSRLRESGQRTTRLTTQSPDVINDALGQIAHSSSPNYSEIIVDQPQFAGLWWRPKETEETPPDELIEASQQSGLPLFILDTDGMHPYGDTAEESVVTPNELTVVSPSIDASILQQELLDRGVFRLAARQERARLAASEQGRLAYICEQPDLEAIVPSEDKGIVLHIAPGHGGSSRVITIEHRNGLPVIEQSTVGQGGSLAPTKKYYHTTQDVPRFAYTDNPITIGDPVLDPMIESTFTDLRVKETDYLKIIATYVEYTRLAIDKLEIAGTDREKIVHQNLQEYLQELGFFLHGFADQAQSGGDSQVSEQARAMAEPLVETSYYTALRRRRMAKVGRFALTREDLT